MKEYSWNITGFYNKFDANEVGRELEKIENLTPENVVDVARNENNVMHDMFEWDDSIAGEKYRKTQASRILAAIQVKIIVDNEPNKQVRAFVTTKRDSNFKPIEKVVKNVDQYALLLDKAYRELNYIKIKYDNLKEIQELLENIPQLD